MLVVMSLPWSKLFRHMVLAKDKRDGLNGKDEGPAGLAQDLGFAVRWIGKDVKREGAVSGAPGRQSPGVGLESPLKLLTRLHSIWGPEGRVLGAGESDDPQAVALRREPGGSLEEST